MTTPQQPPNAVEVRGLGWDIDSPFSSNRGALLPVGSFGHTGYTGTSIWIDPFTNTYIILLTNTVHQRTANVPVISLRGRVATAVAALLKLDVSSPARQKLLTITGYNEVAPSARSWSGTTSLSSNSAMRRPQLPLRQLLRRRRQMACPLPVFLMTNRRPRRRRIVSSTSGW
jgi:CubicO group peptidase (beta-lactamase class C family)